MANKELAKTLDDMPHSGSARIAELEEMVAVLRQALEKAPARFVVQHQGYDRWWLDVCQPALEVTK